MNEQLKKLYEEADTTGNLEDLDKFLKSAAGPYEKLQCETLLNEISSISLDHLDKGACRLNLVELLLKYGADLDFKKEEEIVPVQLAVKNPNITIDVVQLLLNHNVKATGAENKKYCYNAMKVAVTNPNVGPEIVKLILKYGAVPNRKSYWSRHYKHLLIIAVRNHDSNPKIINLLLRYGARVNVRGENKNTALHYALQMEYINLDVVDTLLLNGADMNIANDNGITPLQFAIKNCSGANEYFLFSELVGENTITNRYLRRQGVGDNRTMGSDRQFCLEMCTMSILKHLVLNKTDCDFEQVGGSVSDVICKTFLDDECCRVFRNHTDVPLLKELLCFLIRSVQELAKMKEDHLHSSFTLQGFLVHRKTITVDKMLKNMLKVLELLKFKKYPIYRDVIREAIFAIKRKYIMLMLENMRIYLSPAVRQKIGLQKQLALDFSVISVIAEYLSKKDLFNLMLACGDPIKKQIQNDNFIKTSFFSFGAKRQKKN